MRRLIFLAALLAPALIHSDSGALTADETPLTATAAALSVTSAATAASPTTSESDDSLLMKEGNWWLTIQGGVNYSQPYTNVAVAQAVQNPDTTYDLSPDQASFGGVSLGRALRHHWSLEAGAILLEARHYHVRVEQLTLESDLQRDLQTGFGYMEASHHWDLGSANTLSLGLQAGLGLLFETRHSQVPSQGLDSTELDSDVGFEFSPLLRLDHYFDPLQSFGLEAGYRFFRFSQGSGYDTDPLNFSGVTVALRWSTWIGRGPLTPPDPNAP
jgi:hypothetical protein